MIPENLIISVYKTSISDSDLIRIKPILDNLDKIHTWSIDLEDWENILRIESQYAIEKEIISALDALSVICIELD